MMTIDSHCDTPSAIMRGRNISVDNPGAQVDIPKMKKGGIDAAFFALYIPAEFVSDKATSYALEMLARAKDAIKANSEDICQAFSTEDIRNNKAKGLISILFGMENGSPVRDSLSLLRLFYDMGVRYMTLTHNGDNAIADAAAEGRHWHGLSPFGVEVVKEMNRIHMMIDVAHVSDETFYDCLKYSDKPIVSTHSCCRALCSNPRNMSDDMIRKMSDKGGVIQINFYPCFLAGHFTESSLPGVVDIADHIDHAVNVGGIDHVGIGSDFDGIEITPAGMDNISCMPLVFEELRRRGYNEDAIDKIAGENFLAVFEEVEKS